jgi:hypothetical protein
VFGWRSKPVASNNRSDTHQSTADGLAECAPQYRFDALEPRLLLSADPFSSELARVFQQDAEQNHADAVTKLTE